MNENNRTIINWIYLGISCGYIVSIIYPLLQFVSNLLVGVILAILMGIFLSLASVGLYYFVRLHKKTITSKIAVFSNIIAATLLIQMFLVQLAIKSSKPNVIEESVSWIWNSLNHIHYGLDVAWDVYIFIGTILFAVNAYHHPKLGKTFSIFGVLISLAMIVTNIRAFPLPPESMGTIDFGPFIGLWYLAVTIKITFSRKWIHQKLI
jgi:hypothetical protein